MQLNFKCFNAQLLLAFLSLLPLVTPVAEGAEYRLDRVIPQLEQPWYFNSPQDVSIAPDGTVWVADTDNSRIQHLSSSGEVLGLIGTYGSDPGFFQSPRGIAVAPDGSLWVADSSNHRIQHLKPNGDVLTVIGGDSDNPLFNLPTDVVLAADNTIWVVDSENHMIKHLNANGTVLLEFGSEGENAGEFKRPAAMAIDFYDNSLWVADTENHRIQHFSQFGEYLGQFGLEGSEPTYLSYPNGIAINDDGSLWVSDSGNHTLKLISSDFKLLYYFGGFGTAPGQFEYPLGLALADDGSLWVADWNNYRIQHINADGTPVGQFGSKGEGLGQFFGPVGIVGAQDGSVWVADTYNNRIQHFDANGSALGAFGENGDGPGQLTYPVGIVMASDGTFWVTDSGNNRIQHLKADGTALGQYGSKGSGPGQFNEPFGITLSPDGSFWVVDKGNSRIQHFSNNGTPLQQIGSPGEGTGQFLSPRGIAAASDGSVWVSDSDNHRLQHFSANGEFLGQFGSFGIEAGQFFYPLAIVISPDNSFWISDDFGRVQHFSAQGAYLEEFGSLGSSPGQLNSPYGMTLSKDGTIWLADTLNNRIQKFAVEKIAQQNQNHPFKAVILAGAGETVNGRRNDLWEGTWTVSRKAYNALALQGFAVHDEIKFLTAGNTQFDLDLNKKFDDLEVASKDNLRLAITEWAKDAKDVVIYLADHGGPGKFQINSSEILVREELAAWIAQLEQSIPGKVTVIIEACNSAGFFDALASQGRTRNLFASTEADQLAVLSNRGLNSFSYFFWSEVISGAALKDAFATARQAMSATRIGTRPIYAQADADGNGHFDENLDSGALGDYCLGNCNKTAGLPPGIDPLPNYEISLNGSTSQNFNIHVSHLQPLSHVWALIQRPDDLTIDPTLPLNFAMVPLTCNAQDQCSGKYDSFDVKGEYIVNFYAQDRENDIGYLAIPLKIKQLQGKDIVPVAYFSASQEVNLRDVIVGGQHYQAILQLNQGLFHLKTASNASANYSPAAVFDPASNILDIPLASVDGAPYQAKFKHLGNFVFSLESGGPK